MHLQRCREHVLDTACLIAANVASVSVGRDAHNEVLMSMRNRAARGHVSHDGAGANVVSGFWCTPFRNSRLQALLRQLCVRYASEHSAARQAAPLLAV
jgi:hypothetical protein